MIGLGVAGHTGFKSSAVHSTGAPEVPGLPIANEIAIKADVGDSNRA
jgi:hypothetical protein